MTVLWSVWIHGIYSLMRVEFLTPILLLLFFIPLPKRQRLLDEYSHQFLYWHKDSVRDEHAKRKKNTEISNKGYH